MARPPHAFEKEKDNQTIIWREKERKEIEG
jgi:hypothetical protein